MGPGAENTPSYSQRHSYLDVLPSTVPAEALYPQHLCSGLMF